MKEEYRELIKRTTLANLCATLLIVIGVIMIYLKGDIEDARFLIGLGVGYLLKDVVRK